MNEDEIPMSEQELQDSADFDAGFSLDDEQPDNGGHNDNADNQNDVSGQDEQGSNAQEQALGEQQPPSQQEQPYQVPPQVQQPQATPQQAPVQQAKRIDFLPNEIEDEYKRLREVNPVAAELAMEDSEAGAAVRDRLEQYGADVANDNAMLTLNARRQAYTQQLEHAKAREAHNRNFAETMRLGVPDYVSMTSDPSRKAEADAYKQEVFGWISKQPYDEAVKMMEVAKSGRDPNQVVGLLQRFEKERKAPQRPKRDPTAALHVPSRGGSVPPASVGDKNDFDAGWRLSEQDDN
ncbi:MAG: hypothetical protein R3Y11_01815 [Pseudomonadota bacterium]